MGKYRLVSLFSGCGGMDLGFKNNEFDIVYANDILKDAVATYSKNIGFIENKDIREVKSEDIPDDIDVVIGGFPCQGFSIANKNRSMEDERNFLYRELLRIIRDKKPKFFVAENVKGLLQMENGEVIKMIIKDFENLGYKVDYKLLNAAEYGVPQCRERVIIIGNRIGVENPFPQKLRYVEGVSNINVKDVYPKAITTKQAIGFLANYSTQNLSFNVKTNDIFNIMEQSGMEDIYQFALSINMVQENTIIYNHIAAENVDNIFFARKYDVKQEDVCDYLREWRKKANISINDIDKLLGYSYTAGHWFRKDSSGSIPKPEDWWKLKEILKFDDTYDEKVTSFVEKEITFDQSLRITNWDRPSDTITATSPEIHINKLRRLSVRECAILQTFPMDFEFCGSLSKMYKQIGNAVPVKLAYEIAKAIRLELDKH